MITFNQQHSTCEAMKEHKRTRMNIIYVDVNIGKIKEKLFFFVFFVTFNTSSLNLPNHF